MTTQQKIPEGWLIKNISEFTTVSRGGSPRPIEEYLTKDSDGLNWLRIGDVDSNAKYIYKTSQKIKKEGLNKTTLVNCGDFILSNSMSFGRPYIMQIDACIHDGWLALKNINTNLISKDFLYYLLSSKKIQNTFISVSAGSGVQNLKKETVSCISVKIPLVSEQNLIIEVLETWDKYLEKLDQKIKIKKNIKKGLMQNLLTGNIRLKTFSKEWKFIRLGEICDIEKGEQLNRLNLIKDGLYPAISGGIEPSGYTDKWNAEQGTIIISEGGNSCGFVNLINEKFWCGGHCYSIKKIKTDKNFLYQELKFLERNIMNLRVGSGLPNIQKKDLLKLKIKITDDKKEQEFIVNILMTADKEIEVLEKQREIVKNQKKYLLNNLITGQIRLPEFVNKN